ncbi:hypothetical protein [Ornithinibacillus scapharcae]|uniref:hypothetical protein n=1 Tax=Ornithinibacillus scapharcae TaxID=1147159 RepID=UPI000225B089|nr:hypothetical protein [Ornithinibacillus scapharcae]
MVRFLLIFGIIIFAGSLIFFVMNLIGENDSMLMIGSIFGMLNASIAIGVSEILAKINRD